MSNTVMEVDLKDLIPFHLRKGQTYHGKRLEQLMDSIARSGLLSPIVVRSLPDGKYEIICGHNRVAAMEALGRSTISADVKADLSDEQALRLYYDSNLNQQNFSDWSYSQRLEAVRYVNAQIKANTQQGKRTDLKKKGNAEADSGTCVQSRQKSGRNPTSRDRMAREMGIATATLSKYRSIVKLDDDLLHSIGELLDRKAISFEAAYRISKLTPADAKTLVDLLKPADEKRIDIARLKELQAKSNASSDPLSEAEINAVLVSSDNTSSISDAR